MNEKKYDEVSAGFILYKLSSKTQANSLIEYLILQSSKNPQNWTPPKVSFKFFFKLTFHLET